MAPPIGVRIGTGLPARTVQFGGAHYIDNNRCIHCRDLLCASLILAMDYPVFGGRSAEEGHRLGMGLRGGTVFLECDIISVYAVIYVV